MKKPTIEDVKAHERQEYLSLRGLEECPDCKSWIYKTKDAQKFHYRRCGG